jgi:hypothetical protein
MSRGRIVSEDFWRLGRAMRGPSFFMARCASRTRHIIVAISPAYIIATGMTASMPFKRQSRIWPAHRFIAHLAASRRGGWKGHKAQIQDYPIPQYSQIDVAGVALLWEGFITSWLSMSLEVHHAARACSEVPALVMRLNGEDTATLFELALSS